MKRWFYKKLYLLVAAASERITLVAVKLGRVEDYLYEVSIDADTQSHMERGDVYDCQPN